LFPIIAQALGRVLHTKKFVNRPEFQIFITVLEKVIAAAMLLLLVFLLMFFYFEIKILKSDMLSYFFVLFVGVLFVFFTNALIIFKKSNWSDFKTVISVFTSAKIYYLLPISAFAHLNTLMAMHFLGSTFFLSLKLRLFCPLAHCLCW
jgi:hypothetical protein